MLKFTKNPGIFPVLYMYRGQLNELGTSACAAGYSVQSVVVPVP